MDPSTVEPARGTAACALDKSAWSQSLSGAEFTHTESALLGDPWLSDCAILREWNTNKGPEIFIKADYREGCHLVYRCRGSNSAESYVAAPIRGF